MFERTKKPGDPVETPATPAYQSQSSHQSTPQSGHQSSAPAADSAPRPTAAGPAPARSGKTTVIGPSIQFEGTLRGQEDVFVEGEVMGTIQLQSNTLTIGTSGKIKADVYAHTIFVEGVMEGDLVGSEQVFVRKSAKVRGNITSPRVTLEDGATFKGSIEMDPESVKSILSSASQSNRGPARAASTPQAVPGSGQVSNVGGQTR